MASNQPPPNPEEEQAPVSLVGKPDDPSGRGRTFIATRKIEPGEVILISTPALYPASLSSICFFCSNCYRDLPSKPLRCRLCKVARFCSTECLVISHPTLLCNALPSLISGKPNRLEDRLFISGDSKCPPDFLFLLCTYSLEPSLLLQFISLRTNLAFIPDDALVGTLHSQLTSLINPGNIPFYFSHEITFYILSRKKNHSFPRTLSLTHPQYKDCGVNGVYAYAIHLRVSALNHECLPNVGVFDFFDNRIKSPIILFRALHEIEEATEISISYLPMNTKYRDRQRILMENHGFRCYCVRCDIESQWKEEQDEEPGKRRRRREKRKRERRGRGISGAEHEVPEVGGNWCPYSKFLKKHVCDCGGCMAPYDMVRLNWMECNNCGVVRKDEQTVAEDVREDGQAVAEDGREHEQAVAEDVKENGQVVAEDARDDGQAVAEDVVEDGPVVAENIGEGEEAVAGDARELMRKLLPTMSEKMIKLLLKMLR